LKVKIPTTIFLAGWESKGQTKVPWNLDTTESHSGKASLLLGREPGSRFSENK